MLRSMKRRTVGPSFSRKSVLKTENVRKKTSDVSPWMPSRQPVEQRRARVGDAALRILRRARGVVRPRVVDPALHLVDRIGDARLDLRRLFGDTSEDEQEDDHAERR